jgi:hypothetical protein
MRCVCIARKHESDSVVHLRLEAYSEAREFRLLQPECLNWSDADEQGVVLAAWDGPMLLSTTRALAVRSADEAARAMGCSVGLPSSQFPAIILGRGATVRSAARLGLHSVLRYHVIKSAIAWHYRCVLGMVYSNAPRTNLMREIGYTFLCPERVWDPEVEVIEPVMLGHLSAEFFEHACQRLEEILHDVLNGYPWAGEPISWPAALPGKAAPL